MFLFYRTSTDSLPHLLYKWTRIRVKKQSHQSKTKRQKVGHLVECQQNVRSLPILVSEIVECDYVVNLFVEAVTKPPFSKQETKQEISEKSMVLGQWGIWFSVLVPQATHYAQKIDFNLKIISESFCKTLIQIYLSFSPHQINLLKDLSFLSD